MYLKVTEPLPPLAVGAEARKKKAVSGELVAGKAGAGRNENDTRLQYQTAAFYWKDEPRGILVNGGTR
jgi:hypothetical protein